MVSKMEDAQGYYWQVNGIDGQGELSATIKNDDSFDGSWGGD